MYLLERSLHVSSVMYIKVNVMTNSVLFCVRLSDPHCQHQVVFPEKLFMCLCNYHMCSLTLGCMKHFKPELKPELSNQVWNLKSLYFAIWNIKPQTRILSSTWVKLEWCNPFCSFDLTSIRHSRSQTRMVQSAVSVLRLSTNMIFCTDGLLMDSFH